MSGLSELVTRKGRQCATVGRLTASEHARLHPAGSYKRRSCNQAGGRRVSAATSRRGSDNKLLLTTACLAS